MQVHLTRRGSYAIRAMVSLSRAPAGEHLSARAIAAEQAVPAAFLPRVMTELAKARLVVALEGRTGGYRLARSASDISVLDIVRAVEGPARDGGCILRNAACLAGGEFAAHALIADARAAVANRLRGSSLAAIARTSLDGPGLWVEQESVARLGDLNSTAVAGCAHAWSGILAAGRSR